MKKILLHVCCGPCAIYPLTKILSDEPAAQLAVFYYNPNIHPREEYIKRRDTARDYCLKNKIKFIEPVYDPQEYFAAVKGKEKDKHQRCPVCYRLRLERTARYARDHNFTSFTSTLLISPYQDINLIKQLGEELAEKYGLDFYSNEDKTNRKKYKGFRPGFAFSRVRAKQEKMYRQTYCGCIFSRNGL